MYGVFLVSLPVALLVIWVPQVGVPLAFLPTTWMAALALYYVLAPHWVHVDPRGREHDFTPRKVAVVMEGATTEALLALLGQSSDVVRVTPMSPGRPHGGRTIPGYRRDSFREAPGDGLEEAGGVVEGHGDLLAELAAGEFDFVLYTTAAVRWPPGALHRMSNIAMANRGVAAVTVATPWDWRPGAESTWGRVQYLPPEGTLLNVHHPALRRAGLHPMPTAAQVARHSRHTLIVEEVGTVVRWGLKPPTSYMEHLEYWTAGARFFCLVYLPVYLGVPYGWAFLLYGPALLAHALRALPVALLTTRKRRGGATLSEGGVPGGSDEVRHGHHWCT